MGSPGSKIIRGEKFKLAFCPESTYGSDPGTSGFIYVFGVVETATLPDPLIDYMPIYAMGTSSNRNWYTAYKGRIGLTGAIPEIWLLNGYPLYTPIGSVANTGASGAYVHTVTETTNLKPISVHVTYLDSDNSIALMRRFIGGKVNRAGFEAREGDFLKMSIDEIAFLSLAHNISGETFYSSGVTDISSMSYPTTQPYLFSYGGLSLGGTGFARIRAFRLDVDNGMEPKYYVTQSSVTSQLPYEYREGRRAYRLTCTIDIEDASLYKELVRMGTYTSVYTGFQAKMTFTRLNATTGCNEIIVFTTPATPTSPAAGGDQMGCLIRSVPHPITTDPVVSVNLDILCRSLSIVITDSVQTYPGV